MTITAVCRYWRDICVSTPVLWSHLIDDDTLQLQRLVLMRHPYMPLTISLNCDVSRNIRMLSDPLDLRCNVLGWVSCMHHVITQIERYPLSGAHLEKLTLTGNPTCPEHHEFRTPRPVEGMTLFRNDTPHLRSVSIVDLSWVPTNHFSTITQLLISRCPWHNPVATIVNLLRNTPQLVDLVLSGMHPRLPAEASIREGTEKARLHSLRRLALRNVGPRVIAPLLSELDMASQCVIVMSDFGEFHSIPFRDLRRDISHGLPECLSGFALMQPTIMHLRLFEPASIADRDQPNFTLSIAAVNEHAGVLLRDKHVLPTGLVYEFPTTVFQLSRLQDLCCLDTRNFSTADPWPSRMWSSILPELTATKNLTVFESSLPHITQSLNYIDWAAPLCPHLARITVLLPHKAVRIDEVMLELVSLRERMHFPHVTIGYLPEYTGMRPSQSEQDCHFDSVEYLHLDKVRPVVPPWPDHSRLPDMPPAYWPPFEQWSSNMVPDTRVIRTTRFDRFGRAIDDDSLRGWGSIGPGTRA
ncbi:uncharacterized protein B0H18DRAFT_449064 [Fomitopsis serialis]|uniref:uncharacterized protein n=1 Tax=Fomitopsis serialis TaxID=139415 RepID=UPI00200723D0|nr:uncharacterized protein B0H18DRAFT_449064 [Neoantrodia serialis]KAH9923812.1 hypothetical protein B0H18DRAFT_449064 [Neoantrodia serialis]